MTFADEIIYGHIDNVAKYIAAGADVNEIDDYGFTPLIEAAIADNIEIAKLLIDHNAKVNEPDVVGNTALHWSVENNNLALSKLLLEKGANPNAYTSYGQPILVKPLLRRQQNLKELLYQYGADLKFAQDYIYTKLLGHRFELIGRVDIIDPNGKFIEIDFEGFVLEFSLNIILDSLMQFKNNFGARNLREYFTYFYFIIDAFAAAAELIKYQQYNTNRKRYEKRIDTLLSQDLLFIPIGCEGHAITFIKYKNFLAKCDRGANSLKHPSVEIFRIRNRRAWTVDFVKQLLYTKQDRQFINEGIIQYLNLESITSLPLKSQITGNCSWANIEAAIPTMLLLLMEHPEEEFVLTCFEQWREWDKDRALHECIENFYSASKSRQASLASTLAAILFQTCRFDNPKDLPRINKILSILSKTKELDYILKSYIKIYTQEHKTQIGNNLLQLIDVAG
jgi:hypothetical protein